MILFFREIETSLIPLLVYRNGILSNNIFEIHRSPMIPAYDHLYLYHIPSYHENSLSSFSLSICGTFYKLWGS